MSDTRANDENEVDPREGRAPGPLPAGGLAVICPKCQAHNPPERTSCAECGARLLPGRRFGERIGYLIAGIVGAALFIGLTLLFARMEVAETLPPCCASPFTLALFALSCLVGGLGTAFGRTPPYVKYVQRAQRHTEALPEQALADLDSALALAPEKERGDILHQRGELYLKLGRKEEALADLSAYAASPAAHKGAKVLSGIVGVELEEAAKPLSVTEISIQGLRKELMQAGTLKAVGYCRRCKDAVDLDEARRCARCSKEIKEPRYVKPEAYEATLSELRSQTAARRRWRRIWIAIIGVGLFGCAACVGLGIWSSRMREKAERATATPTAATSAPTRRPAPTRAVVPSPTPTRTPTAAPTQPPTRQPTRTPTVPPTTPPLPGGVVTVAALNMRAGPDTAYDKAGLLREGDEVTVVARTLAGDWLSVLAADGTEGWVSAAYVQLDVPLDDVPLAVEVPPTPTPAER